MPCEHYKDALIEAAATGVTPQGQLRAHLENCDSCLAALAAEQSLFSSIDTGLRAGVIGEIPASLLSRVRARLLDETPSRNRWIFAWAPAAASVALIIGFLFLRSVRHDLRNLPIESNEAVHSLPPVENSAPRPGNPPLEQGLDAYHLHRRPNQQNTLRDSEEPRAFVPAEQPEAIARLLDGLRRGEVKGEVLVAEGNGRQSQDLQIAPLTVDPIDVKALDGAPSSVD